MDSAALQYENQKLLQQLEAQKSEMHALEVKFKELKDEQCSYDKTLISLNKMWNQVLSFASEKSLYAPLPVQHVSHHLCILQLIDDLVLLGVRVGGDLGNLQALDHEELSEGCIKFSFVRSILFL